MTSCLIWEGFRGCQQPVWQPEGCRRGALGVVGSSGDSHFSHRCQLPHVFQGRGQSLAAQNSSSKSGIDARQWHGAPCAQPRSLAGLPLGTQLVCQQLRFIAAFTLSWEVSRPGSPWELEDGGWCCSCPFCNREGAAAVHGVKHRERVWGIVPGRAALLWESIPGIMGRVGASDSLL